MANEYIGREALDALLYRKQMEYSADNERKAIIAIQEARLLLQRFPAADVVEVVRCKDCLCHEPITNFTMGICSELGFYTAPDFFCKRGAKRDGGEHHA